MHIPTLDARRYDMRRSAQSWTKKDCSLSITNIASITWAYGTNNNDWGRERMLERVIRKGHIEVRLSHTRQEILDPLLGCRFREWSSSHRQTYKTLASHGKSDGKHNFDKQIACSTLRFQIENEGYYSKSARTFGKVPPTS